MLTTKRKPATVGEILVEEFMRPMGLTQGAVAAAMGVQLLAAQKRVQITTSEPSVVNQPACGASAAAVPDEGVGHRSFGGTRTAF